jgi:hypothetical protein
MFRVRRYVPHPPEPTEGSVPPFRDLVLAFLAQHVLGEAWRRPALL